MTSRTCTRALTVQNGPQILKRPLYSDFIVEIYWGTDFCFSENGPQDVHGLELGEDQFGGTDWGGGGWWGGRCCG